MKARNVARRFNDAINNQDIESLAELMTPDHRFIDTEGSVVEGKESCVAAWTGFFQAFPDYLNHFEKVQSLDDLAVISGRSSCSVEVLDGPALWTARVHDGLVAEWRVYADTPENRALRQIR